MLCRAHSRDGLRVNILHVMHTVVVAVCLLGTLFAPAVISVTDHLRNGGFFDWTRLFHASLQTCAKVHRENGSEFHFALYSAVGKSAVS